MDTSSAPVHTRLLACIMEENALAIALTRNARFQGSQTVVAQTLGRWADLYCSPSVYPVFPSFEPKPSPTFDSQVITDQRSGQCCHTCNTHDEKASFCLVRILKWDESVGWSFIIATSRSDSSSNKYNNRIICLPPRRSYLAVTLDPSHNEQYVFNRWWMRIPAPPKKAPTPVIFNQNPSKNERQREQTSNKDLACKYHRQRSPSARKWTH